MLGFDSFESTAPPSETLSPREPPIYVQERSLGHGAFGAVDMVVDVTTELKYARKRFLEPAWENDRRIRQWQKEEWLGMIRKEVRIMNSYPHVKPKIVPVIQFWETPIPFLVMPYLSFGNLRSLHTASPITRDETESVVFQTLSGLAHLHAQGVAHRDLNPENILVESRYPLSIKLADFGLADDKSDLRTFCGTLYYLAPEISFDRTYTTAVDLWSLGVVALKYLCGLPKAADQKLRQMSKDQVLSWCHRIIAYAERRMYKTSDGLLNLLVTGMLRAIAEERLSANECLERGYALGLFDAYANKSGTATQHSVKSNTPNLVMMMGPPQSYWALFGVQARHRAKIVREGDLEQSADPTAGFNELQSTSQPSYKRQRSPASGSARTSCKSRIKRVPADVGRRVKSVSRIFAIPQPFEQKRESGQFRAVYDAVLALLADLQVEDPVTLGIDGHTRALVEELCGYFAQLGVTDLRLTKNEHYDLTTITAISTSKEFVVARLTSSHCMTSTADLAAYLLLPLRGSGTAGIPAVPVSQCPVQAAFTAQDDISSWETESGDSHWTSATAQRNGVTYPSELVDITRITGCSVSCLSDL
ncbi:MAG: hypothetical protein Q9210_006032 [Variospora velana]